MEQINAITEQSYRAHLVGNLEPLSIHQLLLFLFDHELAVIYPLHLTGAGDDEIRKLVSGSGLQQVQCKVLRSSGSC